MKSQLFMISCNCVIISAAEDWRFIFSHVLASGNCLRKLCDSISIAGNNLELVRLSSCASLVPCYLSNYHPALPLAQRMTLFPPWITR